MKVLGIIPARKGSKRIPNKNWKELNGKPLITYMIEAALSAKSLDKIVVSTDATEVVAVCKKYPSIEVVMRPEQLAGDESPAVDYVKQVLDVLKEKYQESYDMTVILQPTSPLTLGEDIDATVNCLIKDRQADSAVSVVKLNHMVHPYKLKVMKDSVLLPFIEEENGRMAAHELPQVFVRNCAVYVSRVSVIDSNRIIGDHCIGHEMPESRSIDINDPLDFDFAEFLMLKNKGL